MIKPCLSGAVTVWNKIFCFYTGADDDAIDKAGGNFVSTRILYQESTTGSGFHTDKYKRMAKGTKE